MSRYDEPDNQAGAGGYPPPDAHRGAPRARRRAEDTGSWTSWRMRRVEPDEPPQAGRSSPFTRGGPSAFFRRHPVSSALAIVLTAALTGTTLFAYAAYRGVVDGIHHVTITNAQLGGSARPPELVPGAQNILLIGSDSRAGTNGQYGSTTGPNAIIGSRSDTAMVLHISPDHQHAVVVSFPRDSLVPQYSCQPDGKGHPGQPDNSAAGNTEMLNATYSDGGAPCLWKTIEQTTGIRIDHYAEVNFIGFKKIVDDLGGIKVCLPYRVHNWRAHLYISKGVHVLKGAQALAFVRLRENIGNGTDLERIQRQQFFLASALQKIKQTSLLTDPQRIYAVIKDAAGSLTTDMQLNDMLALANNLKNVSTSSIQFVTVPWTFDQVNIGRVDWLQPQADQLFSAIKHDTKIPKTVKKAAKSSGKTKTTPAPTVNPSQVTLQVLNGTTTAGLAGTTATALANKGFNVSGTGDATASNYSSSVIEYSSASQLAQVNTLKKEIKGAQVKEAPGSSSGLTLILGTSFTGLRHKPKSTKTSSLTGVTQTYGGITGSTNICSDQQAFAP